MSNPAKKRILFIVPSLRRAGAEMQAVTLINGLDPETFENHLFAFEQDLALLDQLDTGQVTFHHHLRRYKTDFSAARHIASLIDQAGIDLIHCTLQIALLFGLAARRISRRKPPVLLAVHTTIPRSMKSVLYNKILYQWVMRACHKIIFVCHNQKDYWEAQYPYLLKKSHVIYNGVDFNRFEPGPWQEPGVDLKRSLNIPENAPIITCIAGFRPEKGHALLVEAFAGLPDQARLLLAGDGPLRPDIERLVQGKHLNDRVFFMGNISDVRPLLAASQVTVLASTAVETFSMAMLESMSMAVPVVATDIGGASEAIKPGRSGDLVPPGDVPRLRDALRDLISDQEKLRSMGDICRSMAISSFSQERMVLETEGLFRSILEG